MNKTSYIQNKNTNTENNQINEKITIALPKTERLINTIKELFESFHITSDAFYLDKHIHSRTLVFDAFDTPKKTDEKYQKNNQKNSTNNNDIKKIIKNLQFILVKNIDTPIYVQNGFADIGFAGSDLIEDLTTKEQSNIYFPCEFYVKNTEKNTQDQKTNTKKTYTRFSLIYAQENENNKLNSALKTVLQDTTPNNKKKKNINTTEYLKNIEYIHNSNFTIGSKYPNITKKYFYKHGIQPNIIKLNGSIELAARPELNMCDFICDIVTTGKTLQDNRLKELTEISRISLQVIACKKSWYTKNEFLTKLISKLSDTINEYDKQYNTNKHQ